MLRTRFVQVLNNQYVPIYHASLGPRSLGAVTGNPRSDYGYLWILTQDPETGAINLSVVRKEDGSDFNWVRLYKSLPSNPDISTANVVSLIIPDAEYVKRASFAFSNKGYPFIAVDKDVPSIGKVVEVYNHNANQVYSLFQVSSSIVFPEYLLSGRLGSPDIYILYLSQGNLSVSYTTLDTSTTPITPQDGGSLSVIPISLRGSIFLISHVYRPYGVELVYGDNSGGTYFVELSPEVLVSEDFVCEDPKLFLDSLRVAYRYLDFVRVGVSEEVYLVWKNYLRKVLERLRDSFSAIVGKVHRSKAIDVFDSASSVASSGALFLWLSLLKQYGDHLSATSNISQRLIQSSLVGEYGDRLSATSGISQSCFVRIYSLSQYEDFLSSFTSLFQIIDKKTFSSSTYDSSESLSGLVADNVLTTFPRTSQDDALLNQELYFSSWLKNLLVALNDFCWEACHIGINLQEVRGEATEDFAFVSIGSYVGVLESSLVESPSQDEALVDLGLGVSIKAVA